MLEFSTARDAESTEEERVPLFSVDGVQYGMTKDIGAGMALQVVERVTMYGEVAAIPWVLRKLVGDAGVEALYEAKNFNPEDLAVLGKIVQEHVMGVLEESGKDSPGESGS